jgi:hypothetical protein
VRLHVAALASHEILKPPADVVEGRIDRGVEILMRFVFVRGTVSDKLATRHRDVDADAVVLAVPRVPMGHLQGDVAGRDPSRQKVELGSPCTDVLLDGIRVRDSVERNL